MKKVAKTPLVVDVLNIQGVQRQLERLADLLGKIQKALGEYLERERASFPRFYFVGDEDLLEIIGNSKSLPKLQKHFKKMFAGVAAIVFNDEENLITGLSSKEGEEVSVFLCLKITRIPAYGLVCVSRITKFSISKGCRLLILLLQLITVTFMISIYEYLKVIQKCFDQY